MSNTDKLVRATSEALGGGGNNDYAQQRATFVSEEARHAIQAAVGAPEEVLQGAFR